MHRLLLVAWLSIALSCGGSSSSRPAAPDGGSGPAGTGGPAGSGAAGVAGRAGSGGAGAPAGTGGGMRPGEGQPCPCPPETYCDLATGRCRVGCVEDGGCSTGRICNDARQCMDGCRTDSACPTGNICDGLVCRPGCRQDGDCGGAGRICSDSTCRMGCRATSECMTAEICDRNVCRRGCEADRDCTTPGDICDDVTRVCRAGCRSGATCPLEQLCNLGALVCMPGCDADSRCLPGRICEGGTCRAGCRNHAACPTGQVCDPSMLVCVMGCGVPGTTANDGMVDRCPLGTACQPINCQLSIGDPCDEFRCQASCNGWMCHMSLAEPWECYGPRDQIYSSRCLLPCRPGGPACPAGETCQMFASDPNNPSFSEAYYCDVPCRDDADCAGCYWGTNSVIGRCMDGICKADINGTPQVCKRVVPTRR